MASKSLIDIAVEVKHQTAKAVLLFDGKKEAWFPKDVVEDNGDGTFTMPEKWAKEKGFI